MAFLAETSRYLPKKVVYNQDLVQFPERYRDLIAQKAGIISRRHVSDEITSDIGAKAVQILLEKAGIASTSINALICATSSPDRIQPQTATRIQELCGLKEAFAFDVSSVCSGAVYALRIASALVKDGLKKIVVVAAEVYSKILNPKDISTFPYFGDGAGAVLVTNEGSYEMSDFILYSDGSRADIIQVPAGGTMMPASKVMREKDFYFRMMGSEVFQFACNKGSEVLIALSMRNGLTPDRVITHQANLNIIKEIASRTDIPLERFFVNVDRYANTAGASVLIALSECLEINPLDKNIFLAVFGGGLSWGGTYLRKV